MLKFLRASTLTTKCVPLTRRCVHFEVKTTPNELVRIVTRFCIFHQLIGCQARIFSAEGVPQAPLSAHIIKPVTFTAQGPRRFFNNVFTLHKRICCCICFAPDQNSSPMADALLKVFFEYNS